MAGRKRGARRREVTGRRAGTGPRLALLPLILAGCYSYQPVLTPDPLRAGQDVRVRYTGDEVAGLRWQVRDGAAFIVEGKVIEWASDAAVLSVPPLPALDPNRRYQTPDTAFIPRSRIAQVELKNMDWSRTTLFVGAIGIGAVIVGRALVRWVGGGDTIVDDVPPGSSIGVPR